MTQPELDLSAGVALKDAGQALVQSHNEDFVSAMRFVAKSIAALAGSVTIDDLREYAQVNGWIPKHPNAWGSVLRGSGLKPQGFVRSKFTSNHSRMIRVWS